MQIQGFYWPKFQDVVWFNILNVLNVSKLRDNFYVHIYIYWCVFHMPLIHMKSKCPVTKFDQQKPWDFLVEVNPCKSGSTLRWRHNDSDGVSNHQPHDCLLNHLFRRRSKKTSKLRVTGLCAGNSPGPVNSPHKGPGTRKMFPFDDVIMHCLNLCGSSLPHTIRAVDPNVVHHTRPIITRPPEVHSH